MNSLQQECSAETKEFNSKENVDEAEVNETPLDATNSGNKLNVEILGKFGCYAKNSMCCDCTQYTKLPACLQNYWAQIIMGVYHFLNIVILIPVNIAHKYQRSIWCTSIAINIAVLQIESAVLYGLSVWAFRDGNHSVEDNLQKNYKPFNAAKMALIIILIGCAFITGFLTGIDDEIWELGKDGWIFEIVLYAFDIIRYVQPAVTIMILYGMYKQNLYNIIMFFIICSVINSK